MKWFCILIFSYFGLNSIIYGQVYINEVCSKNSNNLKDENGEYSDWIELYNTENEAIDLHEYYISDDKSDLYKWNFPNQTILQSKSFLILYADSKNNTNILFHTNFKLSSNGETLYLSKNQSLVQTFPFPEIPENQSYGNASNNPNITSCFRTVSPGNTNEYNDQNPSCATSKINLNYPSGFYDHPLILSLVENSIQDSIFYTTDGTIPNHLSYVYQGNIQLSKTSVLSLIIKYKNQSWSKPSYYSYFINEQKHLPVISIIIDPKDLFSDSIGIYVNGPNASPEYPYYGANFWQNWTRPMHVYFFDNSNTLTIEGDFNTEIHGGKATRTQPMKALRILDIPDNDIKYLDYSFFRNKPATAFKHLVLRNFGSDFNHGMMRDGLVHTIGLDAGLNIDMNGFQPVLVYINGAFWGIHELREKIDNTYLLSNYKLDEGCCDFLEEHNSIISGDSIAFNELHNYIVSNDLTKSEVFDYVKSQFDVLSFCDYIILETYFNNADWPNNNIKYWKPRTIGKWRYVMFDLDASLHAYGWTAPEQDYLQLLLNADKYSENIHVQILKKLLTNPEFKKYFINRYADLINTTLLPDQVNSKIDYITQLELPYLQDHFNKWPTGNINQWKSEVEQSIKPYSEDKPKIQRTGILNEFKLNKLTRITLDANPKDHIEILLNSLKLNHFPWEGIYFDGNPITIEVDASNRFEFDHWEINDTLIGYQYPLDINMNSDLKIKLITKPKKSATPFVVYPNPVIDAMNLELYSEKNGFIDIEITNVLGQLVYQRLNFPILKYWNYIQIQDFPKHSKIYFIKTSGAINASQMIFQAHQK